VDQNSRLRTVLFESHHHVPRLLCDPRSRRVSGDDSEVDAPRGQLDEEEHVESLQRDRLDGQKIVGDDLARLPAQELAPAELAAPRCRLDPATAQDPPDRARRDPDPEPDQLAMYPPVAPRRVLARKSQYELPQLRARRRPAGPPWRIRPPARD
jgi:hypothetical protein